MWKPSIQIFDRIIFAMVLISLVHIPRFWIGSDEIWLLFKSFLQLFLYWINFVENPNFMYASLAVINVWVFMWQDVE